MKKTVVFVLLGFVLVALGALSMSVFGNSFKVTDPNDPRFKIEDFQFDDYAEAQMTDVLSHIFIRDQDRSHVEGILSSIGGAKIAKDKKERVYHYLYKSRRHSEAVGNITAYYSVSDKLEKLLVSGYEVNIKGER